LWVADALVCPKARGARGRTPRTNLVGRRSDGRSSDRRNPTGFVFGRCPEAVPKIGAKCFDRSLRRQSRRCDLSTIVQK